MTQQNEHPDALVEAGFTQYQNVKAERDYLREQVAKMEAALRDAYAKIEHLTFQRDEGYAQAARYRAERDQAVRNEAVYSVVFHHLRGLMDDFERRQQTETDHVLDGLARRAVEAAAQPRQKVLRGRQEPDVSDGAGDDREGGDGEEPLPSIVRAGPAQS